MSRTRSRVAAATIAVVTGAGATAAAIAATHGTSQRTSRTATTSSKPPRSPGRGGGFDADLTAAASYLGVTKAALQTQLKAGKTLGKIASATSGKSTVGLIAALLCALWHWGLVRHRDRADCFKAFLHNHWLGFAVFAGIALDFAVRRNAWPPLP